MHKKILIVVFCVIGLVLAMGDKPSVSSEPPEPPKPLRHQPLANLSVDQLYIRCVTEYRDSQSMNYPEQDGRAVEALELFLNKYPEEPRRFELMYYLAITYSKLARPQEHQRLVNAYFADDPPSANFFTESMELERLSALVWAQEIPQARQLYSDLQERYATSNAVLARVHRSMLPALEAAGDTDGQKAVYQFFHRDNNKDYLSNSLDYYVYAYRLALMEYEAGNAQAAAPLFQEVSAQQNPALMFLAESAQDYLKKIGK
ncbi:hypothetical protein NO2_1160 [Candidatus Termititenax persephonae]|uniref:Outer membrane lipoprotein BamD-like domain-containing protein n=1 Tax=Candidatus Termititenax persephonae TaxID=2218525 RepID=A0A388THK9_9BACT|nr:hypothetical protein NO2_1160 [Candidatus Termititenax persephonae]